MYPAHPFSSSLGILFFLIQFLLGLYIAEGHLNYEELVSLGASCAPYDTCSNTRDKFQDNLLLNTCQCKCSCIKTCTCCIDSPYIGFARYQSYLQPTKETCLNLIGTKLSVFAVNKCRSLKITDPQIKALCENNIGNFKDPLAVIPVTSLSSSSTYKNYFCALCNDVTEGSDLVFWNIRITRDRSQSSEEFDEKAVLQQLVYDDVNGYWGIVDENTSPGLSEPVSMSFEYPSYMADIVNPCIPDLISSCHPEWKNTMVKYKCQRYMGMVYATLNISEYSFPMRKRFRNVHCAICNYADFESENHCSDGMTTFGRPEAAPPLSFSLLLDVNLSDGDRVGEVARCKGKEVYDPFFKKCRTMVCVKPGYKLKNRKCAPS